jgi:hypothetical protein
MSAGKPRRKGFTMTKEQKKADVAKILANSVYMTDSGLMQLLVHSLSKLSKNDLVNLDLVIQIKVRDAAEAAGRG